MADKGQKDLLTRFADLGEETMQRMLSTPGADRLFGAVGGMRDQLDVLTKRVRGMDALERRVEQLERQVETLSKGSGAAAKRASGTTPKRASSTTSKGASGATSKRASETPPKGSASS